MVVQASHEHETADDGSVQLASTSNVGLLVFGYKNNCFILMKQNDNFGH
jgi:lysophospholipid acyltransferase (LPLAT)-like uncharacterized protein